MQNTFCKRRSYSFSPTNYSIAVIIDNNLTCQRTTDITTKRRAMTKDMKKLYNETFLYLKVKNLITSFDDHALLYYLVYKGNGASNSTCNFV